MHLISRRYRKPKGRPSKRRSICAANAMKRWTINVDKTDNDSTVSETVNEENVSIHQENIVDDVFISVSRVDVTQTVSSPANTVRDSSSERSQKSKGRPSKRRSIAAANAMKRWNINVDKTDNDSTASETVNEGEEKKGRGRKK